MIVATFIKWCFISLFVKNMSEKKIAREALEQYRFQTLVLRKKGWKIDEISEASGIDKKEVGRTPWSVCCNKEKLLEKPRGQKEAEII